jgi:diketogulonate reductase-like aldo/keto reductase
MREAGTLPGHLYSASSAILPSSPTYRRPLRFANSDSHQAVGVSNFSKAELIKFSDLLAEHGVPLASNQIEFNLLRQGPMKEGNGLLEEMRKRGIACLACMYLPSYLACLTSKGADPNRV